MERKENMKENKNRSKSHILFLLTISNEINFFIIILTH